MKKSILIAVAAVMTAACGNKTGQNASNTDSLTADTIAVDSIVTPGIDKHSAEYIRQRIDSIYAPYKNPKYEKSGMRIMDPRGDFDGQYCTTRYKALLAEAEEIAGEDDIVLDYDHWTNSQDDNNFTCKVGKISNITDSTAIVQVEAKNFGKPYTITLALLFERDDWYVDDFLSDDGKSGEKQYFREYINTRIMDTIRTFYDDYVFNGKGELPTEEILNNYCTKRLVKKLKDDYDYEGEGFAIWDFYGKDWGGPGDHDINKMDDIKPLGSGKYKVTFHDGNQQLSATVTVIVEKGKILFDSVI